MSIYIKNLNKPVGDEVIVLMPDGAALLKGYPQPLETMEIIEVPPHGRLIDKDINVSCKTNADRIRSMTDEELAEWLNDMQGYSFSCGLIEARISEYPNRYNAWLEWLKEELKE